MARRGDEESNPISRSASPLPSPELGSGIGPARGGHYSYTNVPTTEPDTETETGTQASDYLSASRSGGGKGGKGGNGGKGELEVPRSKDGAPIMGRRRSSGHTDVVRTKR